MDQVIKKGNILLLHSMFCNSKVYYKLLKDLEKDYNIILIDISNHSNNLYYKDANTEAKLIIKKLISLNIFKINYIIAFSFGARISLSLLEENKKLNNIITIEKYILEGAPLYKNAKFRRKVFSILVFLAMKLKNSKYIYYKIRKRVNKAINEILEVIKMYDKKSVSNVIYDCTNFKFFEIEKKEQEKLNFLYPFYDLNILASSRIKKNYKYSNIIFYNGFNTHCSKVFLNSKKYIKEQIKPLLNEVINE